MMKSNVPITNEHGVPLGIYKVAGFLPAFIMIDGALYQRYGQVSDYRYVLEPDMYVPESTEIELY